MFVQFESADKKKREAVLNKRLMLLRCAYLNGYFDEPGSEAIPEIIADGKGPDDAGPTAYGFNTWCQQNEAYYSTPRKNCPTCGALPKSFIDGDCPKCNPPWPRLEKSMEKIAEQEQQLKEGLTAGQLDELNYMELFIEQQQQLRLDAELKATERVCPGCAGHGDRRGMDGENLGKCYICLGTGIDSRRLENQCQHIWTDFGRGKVICLNCGEIIGRDLETGEII